MAEKEIVMEDKMKNYSEATNLLYQGRKIPDCSLQPEGYALFLTSAFNLGNLEDVRHTYDTKGYTYIRTRNPNRKALADELSYLEHGKDSLIFSSGMGAITTTYFALLEPGDHFLANTNLYGETFDSITSLLTKMSVEVEFVDFTDLEAVKKAVKPNTKMVYTEVASNPTDVLADIDALAEIAHSVGALLMVDNTFTTPIAIKPLDHGADIVINSLTKFINGHGDALAGSITVNDMAIYEKVHTIRMLTGTSGEPFTAWQILRGIQTLDLRVKKQQKNAAALAKALASNPHISRVNHPAAPDYEQKEVADKLFASSEQSTGMLSFVMPDDQKKISEFMDRLTLAHYAPTLGGVRTTLSYPLLSSHMHVPQEELDKMGISYGMMRVSVGIEDAEDLVADFLDALKVFD